MGQATSRNRMIVSIIALIMLIAAAGLWWALTRSELAAGRKVEVLPAQASAARLVTDDNGELYYRVTWRGGEEEDLSPVSFAQLLQDDFRSRPIYMRLLNVSSSAGLFWVGIGLLAQVVFMARMIVQWMASEKEKRSIVPPMFWWLSLAGASMLIVYFVWRRDAIGVLGQATGWVVYIRNIMLLAGEKNSAPPTIDAMDEEPTLDPV